jgi:hypothetical protein
MASYRLNGIKTPGWLAVAALCFLFCRCAHAAGGNDNAGAAILLPLPGGTKPEGVCNGRTDDELFVSGLGGWVVHLNATTKVEVWRARVRGRWGRC